MIAHRAITSQGKAGAAHQKHGVAADHDQLAVSEVHQAKDAVDDDQAERHQGIGAAEREHVDQELQPAHASPPR